MSLNKDLTFLKKIINWCLSVLKVLLVNFFLWFYLFYFQQVSADANDGTVDQVSLSNNGTSIGEERTVACVSILF